MTTTRHITALLVLATIGVAPLAGCGAKKSPVSAPPPIVSEFASDVLSDGTVTRAEIDTARAKTLDCLTAEGFGAMFVALDERVSQLQVDSGAPRAGETDIEFEQRFDSTIQTCSDSYLTSIDRVWLRDTAPSEEERGAAFTTLQQCVESFGVAVASDDPAGLAVILERIDDPTTSEADRTELRGCYSTYALATATAEG